MKRILTFTSLALVVLGCGLVALAITNGTSLASGPTFTTIDFPGAVFTLAVDINNSGQILGRYIDTAGINHGFLLSNGTFTTITFPGATFTRAVGINGNGDIVGDYVPQASGNSIRSNGYLLRGGVFTSISFPNADGTTAVGINKNGDIVGFYIDSKGTHGFLLRGGVFSSIDFPGADAFTQAWRINDGGEIDGRYQGGDSKYHVFTLSNGSFSSVPDFPGAVQVAPGNFNEVGGLNNVGDIVSTYCTSNPCTGFGATLINAKGIEHGFLLSGGVFTTIDFPVAFSTEPLGVNDSGDIVGFYGDIKTLGAHGFLRTP